jgi:hypothetical protein
MAVIGVIVIVVDIVAVMSIHIADLQGARLIEVVVTILPRSLLMVEDQGGTDLGHHHLTLLLMVARKGGILVGLGKAVEI